MVAGGSVAIPRLSTLPQETALGSAVYRAALCHPGVGPPRGTVMGAIPICPTVVWEPQHHPALHHR